MRSNLRKVKVHVPYHYQSWRMIDKSWSMLMGRRIVILKKFMFLTTANTIHSLRLCFLCLLPLSNSRPHFRWHLERMTPLPMDMAIGHQKWKWIHVNILRSWTMLTLTTLHAHAKTRSASNCIASALRISQNAMINAGVLTVWTTTNQNIRLRLTKQVRFNPLISVSRLISQLFFRFSFHLTAQKSWCISKQILF